MIFWILFQWSNCFNILVFSTCLDERKILRRNSWAKDFPYVSICSKNNFPMFVEFTIHIIARAQARPSMYLCPQEFTMKERPMWIVQKMKYNIYNLQLPLGDYTSLVVVYSFFGFYTYVTSGITLTGNKIPDEKKNRLSLNQNRLTRESIR